MFYCAFVHICGSDATSEEAADIILFFSQLQFRFRSASCSATSCFFFWTSISIHRRPKQQIWPPELKISLLVSRHYQSLRHSHCSCPSCPLRFDEQAFSSHHTQSGHSVHTPSHTERRSESSGRYSGECPSRTRTCVHGLSHGRNSLNGRNDVWIRVNKTSRPVHPVTCTWL